MSARDDFPLLAKLADAAPGNRQREAVRALAEIDRLRAGSVSADRHHNGFNIDQLHRDAAARSETPAEPCPVLCDDDCDAVCHEEHAVRWRRSHQPEDCPARRAARPQEPQP